MRDISLSCHLDAPVERIWTELQKPATLLFVSHPILAFAPVAPARFPERWEAGDYIVRMMLRGRIPLGRQTISISHPDAPEGSRRIRDNGHSALIKRWDHVITLDPDGTGTRYTDRVSIDAGLLTLPVSRFAKTFYAHRQRRWQFLVETDFKGVTV